jgi:hypothetical protein
MLGASLAPVMVILTGSTLGLLETFPSSPHNVASTSWELDPELNSSGTLFADGFKAAAIFGGNCTRRTTLWPAATMLLPLIDTLPARAAACFARVRMAPPTATTTTQYPATLVVHGVGEAKPHLSLARDHPRLAVDEAAAATAVAAGAAAAATRPPHDFWIPPTRAACTCACVRWGTLSVMTASCANGATLPAVLLAGPRPGGAHALKRAEELLRASCCCERAQPDVVPPVGRARRHACEADAAALPAAVDVRSAACAAAAAGAALLEHAYSKLVLEPVEHSAGATRVPSAATPPCLIPPDRSTWIPIPSPYSIPGNCSARPGVGEMSS